MSCGLKCRVVVTDADLVIELNRLHNNGAFYVNPDLIETIEARPDTTITLVNKHKYVVADHIADVVQRIVDFRGRVAAATGSQGDHAAGGRAMPVIDDFNQEQAA